MKAIPYGRQDIRPEDLEAVMAALQSDYLTQGPTIDAFEKAFADYIGAPYAVAVANGTAALHLSVLALGLNPGDWVITSPITFAASGNCALYAGATVLFAETDAFGTIRPESVQALFQKHGDKIKGVIPVDFAGRPADLNAIKKIANAYGAWVLEDACHAPGAQRHGADGFRCGDCSLADAAIFSFHPVKHIACGEGGMITTSKKEVYQRLLTLRTHGITRDPKRFYNPANLADSSLNPTDDYPLWYMEMQELGYNYRITDMQAALGLSQLKRAEEGLNRRKEIARFYHNALSGIGDLRLPHSESASETEDHAWHLYVVRTQHRKALYDFLRKHHIFAQVHYFPLHLMPYYRTTFGYGPGLCPEAEQFYSECLSIPMYPSLSNEDLNYVAETIKAFFSQNSLVS
jgi:UDP-4-amino-4,6-dideoxy-N-acetyl-beta-L-altrosamine transaminase